MKILVTGYNGFIGRHLTDRLINDGHDVYGVDNFSTSNDDFELVNSTEELYDKFIEFDVTNSAYDWLADEIGSVDVIFHLAALARVQASFNDPVKWHDTNVTGTLKLLEFAKVSKTKKFIFASSSSVYGTSTLFGTSEHYKAHPMSPYALQKLQAEQLCKFYTDAFKMQTISLRYFNAYGENQPVAGNYPQLIPTLLDKYEKSEPFTIYGDGTTRRDFTYVGDIVDANVRAMESECTGVYNVGSGVNYSVNEVCDMIDPEHPRVHLDARREPSATLATIVRTFTMLKWKSKTNLPEWIKSQIS